MQSNGFSVWILWCTFKLDFVENILHDKSDCLPILKNSAVIREVHVYGATIKTNHQDKTKPQHSGLGCKLVKKCEEIALENGYKKIFITSGEGVIRYYENKLGYTLVKDTYNNIEYHIFPREDIL